jgi:hypothetical protein
VLRQGVVSLRGQGVLRQEIVNQGVDITIYELPGQKLFVVEIVGGY